MALAAVAFVSKWIGIAQTAIDLGVGAVARDRADMDRVFGRVDDVAWVHPIVYNKAGFAAFYVALAALAVILAGTRRSLRCTCAALLLIGFIVSGASLDRLPLTACLLTAVLWLIDGLPPAPRGAWPTPGV